MTAGHKSQPVAGVCGPGIASATGLREAGCKADSLSTRRELELLRDLQRLANERAQAEERIRLALADGLHDAERVRDASAAEIERQFSEGRSSATSEYEKVTSAAREQYEAERNAAQKEYKGLRHGVESELSRVKEAARSEKQQASWETLTVFDALKGRPRERFLATVKRLEHSNQELAVLERDAVEIMQLRRQWREFPPLESSRDGHAAADENGRAQEESSAERDGGDPVERAIGHVMRMTSAVREEAIGLHRQKLPRLFEGGTPFGILFMIWLAAVVPCGVLLGWAGWQWMGASIAIAVVVTVGLLAWLRPLARSQSGRQYQKIQQLLADARQALRVALEAARERGQREAQALVANRDEQLVAVEQRVHAMVGERESWSEEQIGQAGQTFPQRLSELRRSLDHSLDTAKKKRAEALSLVTERRDRRENENRDEYAKQVRDLRAEHDRDWESLINRWRTGLAELNEAWDRLRAECGRLFPDWNKTEYETWQHPDEAAPAIMFGQLSLDLSQIKNGISSDVSLRPANTAMRLPALMTLEEHPVLLITAEEEGRREAIEVLQLATLRFLTAMPPGKVRFTILDPVGLGENFASFMHLADFDEQLVASRIWTDARQIDEQLTRLTAHMETVLQKYLRNEFATIHEYNAQAGEVAEPFQILVVANFPTNFSEAAARKLVSIATSGPRCGIYTLIMVDRKQKMPANFDLSDLKVGAVHLDWQTDEAKPAAELVHSLDELPMELPSRAAGKAHFRWLYPAFERLPLALDRPPAAERFNDVVRAAGRAAKDSMKVEVPFEQVAPAQDEYWKGDSGKELVVPIGRAGARRLQSVRLGKGTSQHLLVAGKTGSGKSTFLHGLITNTALIYSPEQVEFYLIDFKKGVEFKTYATHHLPHARVIAIESEREFGLSVLERLDGELRRRGELFRAAGVQDLPDFRTRGADIRVCQTGNDKENWQTGMSAPREAMPRILLVIDEFQELFVEDDKLAQDAGLLLDRLVRQGRAFGIHVLLGSQTLSGAYSLARSTMGQMAVRVALQCSEADAHLILSDERNEAARFLSRPGEAIYNDQNGLLAGNHPFQVVWLPEQQRVEYLKRIEERARVTRREARGTGNTEDRSRTSRLAPRDLIVFEGDQPADPANNLQLREMLEHGSSGVPGAPQKAWLGSAVAIKDPTAATFGRHAGSNLLVVGAWEDSALGVLANAVLALAAQNVAKREARGASGEPEVEHLGPRASSLAPILVLNGTRPESPDAATWQRIADALPGIIEVAGLRDAARVIAQLADELARREAAADDDAPPLYLVIFNGGRFRDLRRSEDDFSFSTDRDKPPAPDKQWAEILRNGPAWGIHTLLWCDTYNNVNRLLDRMTLREFEMRVAFQMSAADSSSLLDNPAAAKLRQHRGLFASEDLGTLEKFRPYGIPTDAWLAEVRRATQNDGTTESTI
ncbi:MAG TPA: FtsK/SpoIIIE domain-containing protein [Lacipirellulaceae bacterium]|nr:FtsK/SpoIIIE domain-containing protein [Lacipirellulaceae bacterium]